MMTPRITIRDKGDADVILEALYVYAKHRMAELGQEAKRIPSDQFSLTLDAMTEVQKLHGLIEAIGQGILPADDDNSGE